MKWSCPHCTLVLDMKEPKPVIHDCPGQPGLMEKIANYSHALKRWTLAGCPVREDDEVVRLEKVCHSCRLYDSDAQECGYCGCDIDRHKMPIVNKLKMATERCPTDQW